MFIEAFSGRWLYPHFFNLCQIENSYLLQIAGCLASPSENLQMDMSSSPFPIQPNFFCKLNKLAAVARNIQIYNYIIILYILLQINNLKSSTFSL